MPDDFALQYRRYCPICPWTLDEPVADDDPKATADAVAAAVSGFAAATGTLDDLIQRASFTGLLAGTLPVERALRAHLESHTLEEWVAAAVKLFMLRQSLAVIEETPAPNEARLYTALCSGALTVNDGRWIRAAAGIVDALKETKEANA